MFHSVANIALCLQFDVEAETIRSYNGHRDAIVEIYNLGEGKMSNNMQQNQPLIYIPWTQKGWILKEKAYLSSVAKFQNYLHKIDKENNDLNEIVNVKKKPNYAEFVFHAD